VGNTSVICLKDGFKLFQSTMFRFTVSVQLKNQFQCILEIIIYTWHKHSNGSCRKKLKSVMQYFSFYTFFKMDESCPFLLYKLLLTSLYKICKL